MTTAWQPDEISRLLAAADLGTTIRWRLTEPDGTYHFDSGGNLDAAVEAELFKIANHLNSIVERHVVERPLRIVITADHGRLTGDSRRTVRAPVGLQVHGRAAWGQGSAVPMLSGPYEIADGIVWLRPADYELPAKQNYAMVLDDRVFVSPDGKSGNERSPHGGLFPEEVLVPWIVLLRDIVVLAPIVSLSGSGQQDQPGVLIGTIANPNPFPVRILSASLVADGRDQALSLEAEIAARASLPVTLTVQRWPVARTTEGHVVFRYQTPLGEERLHRSVVELGGTAIYRTTSILEGLE